MAGARIDDDVGATFVIHHHTRRRHNAHQRVVDRLFEMARIQHHFVVEMQHRRLARQLVLQRHIATLAQGIPEQNRTLRQIGAIVGPQLQGVGWQLRWRQCLLADLFDLLRITLGCNTQALLQQGGNFLRHLLRLAQLLFKVRHGQLRFRVATLILIAANYMETDWIAGIVQCTYYRT
jgi:hypothetical protein